MGRILAIDYGSKRLGIALSDETNKIAFAKPYVSAHSMQDLVMLVAEEGVSEVIMGLPKNLSGDETAAANAAREFAERFTEETGLPVRFIDERFSTKEVLRENRGEKGYKGYKGVIDSLVAQKMLQRYLEK